MMMFKNYHTLAITLVVIICSCDNTSKTTEEVKPSLSSVMGSWDLDQYIPHSINSIEWTRYGDTILYQKHITDTHFTWLKYDTKNDNLLGMGGGNYKVDSSQYTENIEFFYPPGSSELGQSIPFQMTFKDGKWYHTGFSKLFDLDEETGELVEVGLNKIEEIWKPTRLTSNPVSNLQHTWDLQQYRDKLGNEYIEYPDFTGYIKLITPTHFIWTKYDKEGDEIYGAGAGSYTFSDKKYIENIEAIHPENTGQVGSAIRFDILVNDNKWKHFGYVPVYKVDETNGNIFKDSILIDELWVPHKLEMTEELFF